MDQTHAEYVYIVFFRLLGESKIFFSVSGLEHVLNDTTKKNIQQNFGKSEYFE